MKYSRQIFANPLFVAACFLAPKFFATAESDCPAALGSCTNDDCDSETQLLCGSSSVLPPSMVDTLKEMKMQQNKSSGSSNDDEESSSFSFVLGPKQDPEYMKTQIKTFLSSVDIEAEVLDEDENGDTLSIDLSGVSLESLPYGPFEFAYFLEKEFSVKKAEPRLSSVGSFAADAEDKKNVCNDINNKEWHLKHVKAPEAWKFSEEEGKLSQGEGVIIAQIDTGYSDHGIFTDDVWIDTSSKGMNMYNFEKPKGDPKDKIRSAFGIGPGHGTGVASHAVGRGNVMMKDSTGTLSPGKMYPKGTAPKAKLYSIRAMNNPLIDFRDAPRINEAFRKIRDNKDVEVDVISMSFAFPARILVRSGLEGLIKKTVDKNIIVVAAGGQYVPKAGVLLPAAFDDVIAVGGYCIADTKKDFYYESKMKWWPEAHFGEKIDISAPALNVCNAVVEKGEKNPYTYRDGEGTSVATAMTAGIAALWLAHHGKDNLIEHFKKDEITLQAAFKKVLELAANTSTDWDQDSKDWNTDIHGHGMIDAEKILKTSLDEITKKVNDEKDNKSRSGPVRQERGAPEQESEEAAALREMTNFLLEMGYDEDTLKLLQRNKDDLEHFFTELVYMKSKDNVVMSSELRVKLGQD